MVERYCTMVMSWRGKPHLSPAWLINCEDYVVTVTGRFAQLEVEKQAESYDKKVEKGSILDFLMPSINFSRRERQGEQRLERAGSPFRRMSTAQ